MSASCMIYALFVLMWTGLLLLTKRILVGPAVTQIPAGNGEITFRKLLCVGKKKFSFKI